jgi:hypothetical protein
VCRKERGNSGFPGGCCATRLHYEKATIVSSANIGVLEKRVEAKNLLSVRFVGCLSAKTAIGDPLLERQQCCPLAPSGEHN